MKNCSKCGKRKSLNKFYKDKYKKDGFTFQCKCCINNYRKEHYIVNCGKENKQKKIYHKTIKGTLINRFGAINQRCYNKNNKSYKNYGGRGIKNKFNSTKEFINYVINELRIDPRRLCIHRINNNGNYEPGNIQFITNKEHGKKHKTN